MVGSEQVEAAVQIQVDDEGQTNVRVLRNCLVSEFDGIDERPGAVGAGNQEPAAIPPLPRVQIHFGY